MRIGIINGPNLNLLGKREPEIYGSQSFEDYFESLKIKNESIDLYYFQSNHEGELIDKVQAWGFELNGILINPGGLTHSSVSLRDAISAVPAKFVEIHISNIHNREEFRHTSLISPVCIGTILGLGLTGYQLGLDYFQFHESH